MKNFFPCIVHDPPTNVRATELTPCSVEITWDPPSNAADVTGYLISYITNASYASDGSERVNNSATTSYNLTKLEENTPYIIIVQATSGAGRSGGNNSVSVTTYTASK